MGRPYLSAKSGRWRKAAPLLHYANSVFNSAGRLSSSLTYVANASMSQMHVPPCLDVFSKSMFTMRVHHQHTLFSTRANEPLQHSCTGRLSSTRAKEAVASPALVQRSSPALVQRSSSKFVHDDAQ